MTWRNTGWWLLYCIVAITLQALMPGIDFMLPGLLLALQERHHVQSLCVGTIFLILQEGMGSMPFGSTLLLYALAVICFYAACSLFEGRSALFVILLGMVLAAMHAFTFVLVASLQDIPWQASVLQAECLFQAFFTPVVWWAASSLRGLMVHESRT